MKLRYLGPMVVVTRNKGGAYIVAELNGSVWHEKVGAFRIIPYHARKKIALPNKLLDFIDITEDTLNELREAADASRVIEDIWFDRVDIDPDKADASDDEVDTDGSDSASSSDSEKEVGDEDGDVRVRKSARLRRMGVSR
jgi:hypothetical protein